MSNNDEILYTANLTGSLRLSNNGEWFHNGVRFQNDRLAKLFHRSIEWDDKEQQYFVRIGKQRARFDKDDTAYFVVAIDDTLDPWGLILADESHETLNIESLARGKEEQVYCTVKGSHRARLTRQAYQVLVEHVVDEEHVAIGSTLVCLKNC